MGKKPSGRIDLAPINQCPQCGYALRGGANDGVCPECGLSYTQKDCTSYVLQYPIFDWSPKAFLNVAYLLGVGIAIDWYLGTTPRILITYTAALVGLYFSWKLIRRFFGGGTVGIRSEGIAYSGDMRVVKIVPWHDVYDIKIKGRGKYWCVAFKCRWHFYHVFPCGRDRAAAETALACAKELQRAAMGEAE